ncbi:roundabout homolog 1-like isoform X1 [Stylophora pistillata]|uniref:roundabout homolog 1-like isoform X1 n=1 Tax=Stylophora pistillata TaxID=50429 RepID=UPI000C04E110|nr:roundabout homolog 1-like isoform X1 [Stylophora pistillata]
MMRFVFIILCINLLLGFTEGSKRPRCDNAYWWESLDRAKWSVCPKTNTYLRGFWRSAFQRGDERVGRLEEGRCCDAVLPLYAGQPATCSNTDWSDRLNRYNVWALCPSGYFMNGLRLDRSLPAFLNNIAEAKCCRPQNHPSSSDDCYDEDVTISFDKKGWSECQRDGFYMTGFYKSDCNNLYCIEKFRCCKMINESKKVLEKKELYFNIGSNEELRCSIHNETSYAGWAINGQKLQTANSTSQRIRTKETGELFIDKVQLSDAGLYECYRLEYVQYYIVYVNAKFTDNTLDQQTLTAGTSGIISCGAQGEPSPQIYWRKKGGNSFDHRRFTQVSNGSLHISPVKPEDNGTFICTSKQTKGAKRVTSNDKDILVTIRSE